MDKPSPSGPGPKRPVKFGGSKRNAAKRVPKKKKKIFFKFREFRVTQPVDMRNYVMEYTIPNEQVMEFRKNKIKYANNPKLEVRDSKASVLKDEFNGWCGRKQGIRNWLYYV